MVRYFLYAAKPIRLSTLNSQHSTLNSYLSSLPMVLTAPAPVILIPEVIFLLISFIRAVILLVTVMLSLRLMGKRQIGELQPTELVTTILLSEIAVVPMQDNDIPMLNSLVAVCVLVGIEILLGAVSVKSDRFRSVLQGNAVILINDGVLDQKNMKKLRYNLDDVLEALRQKNVFDIADVQYAFAETNGSLSVLLKPEKRPLSAAQAGKTPEDAGVASALVMDGKMIGRRLSESGVTPERLRRIIEQTGVRQEDIFLLTVNKQGQVNVIEREKGQ